MCLFIAVMVTRSVKNNSQFPYELLFELISSAPQREANRDSTFSSYCSFFIPTEENTPGIQLPMAGEATDLNCLFPKSIQLLAVFHPNVSFYPQIRVSLSSHKGASSAAAGDRPRTDQSAQDKWLWAAYLQLIHLQHKSYSKAQGKSWNRGRLLAARYSIPREGKMNS